MRIVGGTLGGRRFDGPPGDRTRPTSERVREALASALQARDAIEGAQVLDLYAGTGALAFEALSRGAARALLVDLDRAVIRALQKSVDSLGLGARARIEPLDLHGDARSLASRLRRHAAPPFTLVFADPPYAKVDRVPPILRALAHEGVIASDALIVLEHARKRPPAELHELASLAAYGYGDTAVAFLRPEPYVGEQPS